MPNVVDVLITWTPYLAVGFGWNMLVSLVAMAIGTVLGAALAALRGGRIRRVSQGASALTLVAASAPTFVMLFYLAYMVPGSFVVFGIAFTVPVWLKASLALSIAVAGFVSDNALAALRHLRRGQTTEALLFLPSWTNYFLIIVMASATASVIGVPEMVFRVDTVIAALARPQLSFWIYLYAMGWFLGFAGLVALVMRFAHVRRRDTSISLSRHLILIVTGSVGIAILSVAVALGLLARDTLIDQAENQARMVAGLIASEANRVGVIADEIDRVIVSENEAQAIAVGQLADILGDDDRALSIELAEITANTAVDDVWVLDAEGTPSVRATNGIGQAGVDISLGEMDGPVLQTLISGRRFSVSFKSVPRDGLELPLRYLGVRSRQGRTVLVGSVANKTTGLRETIGLAAALDSLAAQPGIRAIWVVDESLKVTAAVAAGAGHHGPRPVFGSSDRSLAGRAVQGATQSFISDDALHVAAPILDRGGVATGVAVIHMPRDHLDELLGDYIDFGLAITLAAFLIGAVTAIMSARRITRPVTALTQAAGEMDQGSFEPDSLDPFRDRRDELGRLIHTFQTMAREVQARREHLEALVAERTLDLANKNALLDEANRRMEDELAVAHSLQHAILPKTLPPDNAYSGDAVMTPAREMAGDFYDYFSLPDGRLGLVIADVSGKGVAAAFFMAITRTVMRASAQEIGQAGACMRVVNDRISSENPHDLFVTLFYGILDPKTGILTYANAGHNAPFLIRTTGAIETLPLTGGVAVGVLPELEYDENRVTLGVGDTLFLYTDGISEAMNIQGETFDESRLESALSIGPGAPVDTVIGNVTLAVGEFVGDAEQSDDITCLVLRYNGKDV
ncbi:MAG: SpoIIE family protein phosphatase [Defluviicoccus sp.]|nr:SpoIIE family protein phosphatase [Defluviicoccus sp.]MDE0384916.1 SpoIIE family protein phosphatase [Defluviicoccus sp.]